MQYCIKHKISAFELSTALNLRFEGIQSQLIHSIGSLANINSNVLKFSNKHQDDFTNGIVIGLAGTNADSLIVSENPRLDFCRALDFLITSEFLVKTKTKAQIHNAALISNSAIIEDDVVIGSGTIIEHNVVIHSGTVIGKNSIIRANTVIGAQGFGFEKNHNGTLIRFPHLGKVIIGDNVEIGALNSVCIGALDDTIICDGVKTDNLVHIAHNCHIGKNSIITACTELSGGVVLGEGVWMGPNSSTMQKVKIDDYALVGLGTVVTKNVEKHNTVAGVPAKVIRRG